MEEQTDLPSCILQRSMVNSKFKKRIIPMVYFHKLSSQLKTIKNMQFQTPVIKTYQPRTRKSRKEIWRRILITWWRWIPQLITNSTVKYCHRMICFTMSKTKISGFKINKIIHRLNRIQICWGLPIKYWRLKIIFKKII